MHLGERLITFCCMSLFALCLNPACPELHSQDASKKQFSYQQAFGASAAALSAGLIRELPKITGWLDDDSYLEVRSDAGSGRKRLFKVNAADGQGQVYRDYADIQKDLPSGIDIENPAAATSDLNRFIFVRDNRAR